ILVINHRNPPQRYCFFSIYASIWAKKVLKTLFLSVFDALRAVFLVFRVQKQKEAPESASLLRTMHLRNTVKAYIFRKNTVQYIGSFSYCRKDDCRKNATKVDDEGLSQGCDKSARCF
ncbi:MAG: hypothetical protein J5937_02630, partial [Paludibacteraceae bacterium]|nr:hypothetical protein [Paludibacteraceae bacterium]